MINRMLISMVVLSIATSAHAGIAPKDASYFCVAEIAGGLRYNERTKKWEGATFKPDAKFVMRMKHLRSETRKDSRGKDEPAQVFDVTITPERGRVAETCLTPDVSVVFSSDRMRFRCLGVRHDYQFNLENNRFLLFGFFDGTDDNENTPAVTGGVCAKID